MFGGNQRLLAVQGPEPDQMPFLGRLSWFTIRETRIDRYSLENIIHQIGLNSSRYLPKPINSKDALRRATKEAETKRARLDGDKYLNLMIREVKKDPIVRQMVREVVDARNVRLDYKPVYQWSLIDDQLDECQLAGDLYPCEREAIEKVIRLYPECCRYYNGTTIRNLVQDILGTCSPVSVRPSGGVYFTPENYSPMIDDLEGLIACLKPFAVDQPSTFYSIPVIDGEKHRMMIKESVEDQVKSEAQALIREMADLIKGQGQDGTRTITPKLIQQYIERIKSLNAQCREYRELLEMEIENVDSVLQIAKKQAEKMLEVVDF